jgi:Spy/CpxP family protein refolding chaperone
MSSRLTQALLGLSLLLNLFVLTGFVYRSWIAPPEIERRWPGPPLGPGGQRMNPLDMLANELKLDDAQRAATKDIFEQYSAGRRERQRETQRLREAMVAELKKPDTDLTKLEPIVDQISKLRADSQKENLRAMIALAPKLRADQRDKLETLMADRLGGWWGRPGGRGPGGPDGPRGPRPPQ